jgi:MoaA/NifB/PqqE/SkfB family radical SAM enzyme
MELSGLHLLLTFQCTFECDHCFVYGSPWQRGTMTLRRIDEILRQGKELGTVDWIYFEGGEPFLYHAVLLAGVRRAADAGFRVGVVSNAYWATDVEDALEWLRPFRGKVADLDLSNDAYHGDEGRRPEVDNARKAAEELGIPIREIRIAPPEAEGAEAGKGQIPAGESAVMFRGRAAEKLAGQARKSPWTSFTECPHEDLRDPGRVHIDPLGNVHLCQGISIGNLFRTPLAKICAEYTPERHPIAAPVLEGGPVELVRRYVLSHGDEYADACHLCEEARQALRTHFPDTLTPDQMYGEPESA